MPGLKLQSLRRAQLMECARLCAAVFSGAPWNQKWTVPGAARHIRETFRSPDFRGVVALENGKVIGFAYGVFFQWEDERRFYLKEMCVHGDQQGRGVGTRLLGRLMKELEAEKVNQISLGTEKDKPARSFYLKLGFAVDANLIYMSKRLRSARSKKS